MGYVLQDGGLFPHLTVRDNVALMPRYLKAFSEEDLKRRIQELADLTKLPPLRWIAFQHKSPVGNASAWPSCVDWCSIHRSCCSTNPWVRLIHWCVTTYKPTCKTSLSASRRRSSWSRMIWARPAFLVTMSFSWPGGRIVQRGAIEDFYERRPAEEFVTRFITAQRAPNSRKTAI